MTKILFFGSTNDSVIVLEKLVTLSPVNWSLCAIVTQPPKPIGRDKTITPTPVEVWAKEHTIACLSFENDPEKPWLYKNTQQVIDTLQPIAPDVLLSASYGQMIPWDTIRQTRFGGINVHPSILPHWRGADPVPWAIMSGDHQIGVTVTTLSQTFDEGKILAQEKIPIEPKDTSDPLRTKLFIIGANLLLETLPLVISGKIKPKEMYTSSRAKRSEPVEIASHTARNDKTLKYARKFTRDDGFEAWEQLKHAVVDGTDADRIDRKFRALDPWPGVWTLVQTSKEKIENSEQKRLKILKLHLGNGKIIIDEVQLEGKKPVTWEQFNAAYHLI